jgi:RNA polymerase sigma-70 factor (ECF subfamily)
LRGEPPRARIGPPGAASNPPGDSDADLVARARSGDTAAFRTLVERTQGRAFRLALRVLRDEEAARDVVQDALLKAYGSLDRFEGRSGFYTWLYRIVMNLCLDRKRRDRSDRHVE